MIRNFSGLIPLLISVAFALATGRLGADPGVPPPPMDMTIKVKREVRTEIPLQIYGRRNELLKFLIHKAPEHGKLTEPQQTGKETAAVIYDPPADLGITHDKFYYSVQSSAGVSSPVEVSITITDAPPILAFPDSVDFPKILAGTTSTKIIELGNKGGGLAVGEMIVDAPWRIVGSTTYKIGAAEVVAYKLVFEPKEGGSFEGAISFTSNRGHSTSLRGEAFTPLSVSPAKVVMENLSGTPVRTASFDLANQTDEGRTVRIRGGARLLTPDQVSIPARGKVNIPIHTLASDVGLIDEEIRIESDGFSLGVPVKSPAVGPIFSVSADHISLGRQPAARPGAGSLTIENMGGSPGAVVIEVTAPFAVSPPRALLNAGEKKVFQITLAPSAAGSYRTWLEVKGERQEFEVGLDAELYASPRGPVATGYEPLVPGPEEQPSPDRAAPSDDGRAKDLTPIVPKDWGVLTAPAPGVVLLRTSPHSATFEWPEKLSSATRFRIDLRHIGLDTSRELQVSWFEHHPVTVQRQNGFYVATLGDLRPGALCSVQVTPLSDAGAPGPRLFAFDFYTPAAAPSGSQISPLQWLFAGFLICGCIWLWRAISQRPTNFL